MSSYLDQNGTQYLWGKIKTWVGNQGYLKTHQTVTDASPTLSWGATSKVATIGNTDIHVTMPSNPNTDTKVTQTKTTVSGVKYLIFSNSTDTNTDGVSKDSRFYLNNSPSLIVQDDSNRQASLTPSVGIDINNGKSVGTRLQYDDVIMYGSGNTWDGSHSSLKNALAGKAAKATTLSGYGITDAKISSGTITLGSNSITPLTSHQDISGKVNKSGDTMTGALNFNSRGSCSIYNGPNDQASGAGGSLNNFVISSWYGVSFTTACTGQTYTGKNAVSINCRNGNVDVGGTLTLARDTDASPSSDAKPALIVGGTSTQAHIEMDNNEILAKANGTTMSTLYLQDGGTLSLQGGDYSVRNADKFRTAIGMGNATINKGATGWGTTTGSVTCVTSHCLILTDKWFGILWLHGTNDISVNYVHTDGKAYNATGTGSVTWGNGKYKATRSGKNITVTSTSKSGMTLLGV